MIHHSFRKKMKTFVSHTNMADTVGSPDVDVSKFEKPGAMRAGFETYRAFTQDAKDLSAAVKARGKLNLPVLLLAGEASTFIPVRYVIVPTMIH
jgi:hypothetical protein